LRDQRELAQGTDALSKLYQQLSSGQRINQASKVQCSVADMHAMSILIERRIADMEERIFYGPVAARAIARNWSGEGSRRFDI